MCAFDECVCAFWLMRVHHKYVHVYVNVKGQCLGIFWGEGRLVQWQPQLCWIVGEKELTRRELMSDMTPLSRHAAGSWELLLTECVCVSVRMKVEKKKQETQQSEQQQLVTFLTLPQYIFNTNPDLSDIQSTVSLSVKQHLDRRDTGLFLLCNPIFFSLFLPPPSIFSPYISCTSPWPSRSLLVSLCSLLLTHSPQSVSPEGAFKIVKWSKGAMPDVRPILPRSSCFCLWQSHLSMHHPFCFISHPLTHPQSKTPPHTHRHLCTSIHFYSLSLLSGSSALPSVSDKCPQSPHCLMWPSILPPSPFSLHPGAAKREVKRRGRLSWANTPTCFTFTLYSIISFSSEYSTLFLGHILFPSLQLSGVLWLLSLGGLTSLSRETLPHRSHNGHWCF